MDAFETLTLLCTALSMTSCMGAFVPREQGQPSEKQAPEMILGRFAVSSQPVLAYMQMRCICAESLATLRCIMQRQQATVKRRDFSYK